MSVVRTTAGAGLAPPLYVPLPGAWWWVDPRPRHFHHPASPGDQFYDLKENPFETRSPVRREKTVEQTERLRALLAELERLRASVDNPGK